MHLINKLTSKTLDFSNSMTELNKYKSRVIAKGFKQNKGKDYTKTFSPIVNPNIV